MTDQERLDDARAQYHLLVTGTQARVLVDTDGKRVEYSLANRGALLAYIERLERKIAGTSTGPMRILM